VLSSFPITLPFTFHVPYRHVIIEYILRVEGNTHAE
jgi:hypothetical protein